MLTIAPPPDCNNGRNLVLHSEPDPRQIDVDHALPILNGAFGGVADPRRDPRVIHCKIEPAELLDGERNAFHGDAFVGDIPDTHHRPGAGLFHGSQRFLQGLRRSAIKHKSCAKLCERNSRSLANTFSRARDYDDAAIKRLRIHVSRFLSSRFPSGRQGNYWRAFGRFCGRPLFPNHLGLWLLLSAGLLHESTLTVIE
jgi:hypothetical protein